MADYRAHHKAYKERHNMKPGTEARLHNWTLVRCPDVLHQSFMSRPPTYLSSYELWHYNTCMLQWMEHDRTWRILKDTVWTSIGTGSKSDQDGMNAAFQALKLPYRYDRNGKNPRISAVTATAAATAAA